MKKSKLSPPLQRTFAAVEKLLEEQGRSPSIEELASELSISIACVHAHLQQLIELNYLRKRTGKARSLEVVNHQVTEMGLVQVPLIGNVAAGIPIEAIENPEGYITIDANLVGDEECFALKVVGESMINARILDGDVLIVRRQPIVEHGKIVVALIDGEVTVKKFSFQSNVIELIPENDAFKSIRIHPRQDFRIIGEVIAKCRMQRVPAMHSRNGI